MKRIGVVFLLKCLLISMFLVAVLVVSAGAMIDEMLEAQDEKAEAQCLKAVPLQQFLFRKRMIQKFKVAHAALLSAVGEGDVAKVKQILSENHDVADYLIIIKEKRGINARDQLWESEIDLFTTLELWVVLRKYYSSIG